MIAVVAKRRRWFPGEFIAGELVCAAAASSIENPETVVPLLARCLMISPASVLLETGIVPKSVPHVFALSSCRPG
jgi:hypothetical protein